MSANDEQERAIEFARAALARARAHARTSTRLGWQTSRARSGRLWGGRWGAEPGEAVYSSASFDRRDPAPLGAALSELISMQGWGEALTVAGVTARWAEIVGPDVAEHVKVEAFEVGDASDAGVAAGGAPSAVQDAPGTDSSTSGSLMEASESHVDTPSAAAAGGVSNKARATTNSARIVVRADSTAWATQLRLLLPALRRRIADDLAVLATQAGYPASQAWQVEVTVLAPSAPSWRKGARHISGRGPRDTYG